jgi:hypothetical protein
MRQFITAEEYEEIKFIGKQAVKIPLEDLQELHERFRILKQVKEKSELNTFSYEQGLGYTQGSNIA